MADIDLTMVQISEEVQADRIKAFWKKYRDWIIGGFILFFAALIAFVAWRSWQLERDQEASALYLAAMESYRNNKWPAARESLNALLEDYDDHGYAKLGRMLLARVHMAEENSAEALKQLESLANELEPGAPFRESALLNAAYIVSEDSAKAQGYLSRMAPDSPFKAQAMELEGLLAAKGGAKPEQVLEIYRQALSKGAAGALKQRLEMRLERSQGWPEPPAPAQDAQPAVADKTAGADKATGSESAADTGKKVAGEATGAAESATQEIDKSVKAQEAPTPAAPVAEEGQAATPSTDSATMTDGNDAAVQATPSGDAAPAEKSVSAATDEPPAGTGEAENNPQGNTPAPQ